MAKKKTSEKLLTTTDKWAVFDDDGHTVGYVTPEVVENYNPFFGQATSYTRYNGLVFDDLASAITLGPRNSLSAAVRYVREAAHNQKFWATQKAQEVNNG